MCLFCYTNRRETVLVASLYILCNSNLQSLNAMCQSRHPTRSSITRSPSKEVKSCDGYNMLLPRLIHFRGQCSSGVSITSSAKTRGEHKKKLKCMSHVCIGFTFAILVKAMLTFTDFTIRHG
jgi:hypothetical protein